MKNWYVKSNDKWHLIKSNVSPTGYEYVIELDSKIPADIYVLFEDEDGTYVALLSETKLANYIDEQRRIAWENGWPFNLDLSL